MKRLLKTALAWAVIATPLFATTAHAALGVCDAAPPDNVEVEATAGTPGPTSYNTLKAAFDAINAGTHQGSISIEVCGNTTEAASAVLNASGAGAAVYTAVSVKPVGGVARSITGALAAPLVDLNGADSVTIDGLNTGGNSLTLNNTSTAVTAGTGTIRFIGGASGNTVTRASVLGASLAPLGTAGGTIAFSTDTVALTGNDNNTISFCDIGPSSAATLPIKAVFGLGSTTTTPNHNSGVVIDSNNIFDFFGAGTASVSGINILGGNDAWTISNNKFYQTAPRTFTAAARYAGISINTTIGAFTITGNTIGFGASNGTGTTTISGAANEFRGIDTVNTNLVTPTSIQGNVISGINQSTSDSGTTTSAPFTGIMAGSNDGRYNVGDVTGNRIGSLDGSSTIVVSDSTATTSLVYGILDFSFQSNTVSNNQIGAITIQGTGTTTGFRGIAWNTGAALTETVANNTIGGSAAGAIVDTQVGNNAVYGIQGQSAAAIVSGNVITNLSANSISAAAPIITAGGLNISSTSTTVASSISRNTVRAISNNAGASANSGAIYGISVTLPNTLANLVERNFIDSLSATSTVTSYQLAGIVASQGTTTYRNNMISLGFDAAGNPITTGFLVIGLFDPGAAAATNSQLYFNSVYIGGSGVAVSTSNSYALYSNVITNVRNFQNNILWNQRGNAVAAGAPHFAIRLGTSTTGLTSNTNDLLANGTDGAVGVANAVVYATLANWQTGTSLDALSLSVNPTFVSTSNLHLLSGSPVIGMGATIAGITDDFDGDVRPGASPAIGADEFVAVTHTVTPSVGTASGTISPSTPQVVVDGATTAFTLTPAVGFHINNVTGTCGGSLVASTYTTNPVTTNCTVIANFAADVVTHTVTPSVGTPSGTISPSTPQVVNDGATTAFTLTPAVGFHINNVTGTCGGSLVANTYTTNAVTANCTVIANFAADVVTHTVTPSVGTPSGTISPSTPQVVNDGATTAFTLTPAVGFHINNVTGTCGGALVASTYTTNAVTADCTVIANFAADVAGTFPPDENFDEVTAPALPAGWVSSATDWTTVTDAADTAPNAAFATDLPTISDFTLDSPVFTPAGTTTLTFRHQFNLENTYDGAVVEISINGGPYADVITAGGSFGAGGYIGPISTGFNSPIAGRQAWTGASAGFITSVITLPSAATGQPTKLRFRTADDSSVAPTGGGWWVDSIHLSFATLPSVAKAFAPSTVQVTVDSTLTLTLTNPTVTAATLTANLVDTFPAGLVATAASATTTCTGGAGASNTSGSVTLGTGAVIPANGSCTVVATVHSAAAGSYANTIAVGALQTTIGNNDTAANATLTVTTPPHAVVTPSPLAVSAPAGGTGSTPLNVANTGGSNLIFAMSEGTTLTAKPSSYKSVSKAADEMRAKYGAASLARNPKAGMAPAMHRPVPVLGALDISQMADNTPGDQGVSCNSTTATTANSWWRRFYFSEHPGVGASTNVTSVTISSGSTGPSGVPVTINLYTIPHGTTIDTIPTASLTLIGTGAGTINSGLVSVTIPVAGAIADTAGSDLVVEYHIEAVSTGAFFPGANATAETHPTFLSASDCGISEPTPASAVGPGFPDFHLTMIVNVGGTPPATCANPADIPWLSESPAGGSVAPGANTNVAINADASALAQGTYTANVCVGSNDPVNPLITVPVTLTVTEAPFVLCPNNPEEVFCDGFDPTGGQAGTYTDRTTFLTHVAAGFFDNPFADAVPGAIASLSYTNGGWAYTVTASTDQLFNDTGLISTNLAADAIVVTFTGDPVTAVGGNFWATDINVAPTGTDITILLSDGTTETFTSTGPTDFRGFTTVAPITTITIDAPDDAGNFWPTMDNLIIGTGN